MRGAHIPHLAPRASPQGTGSSQSELGTAATRSLLCPLQLGATHRHHARPGVALGSTDSPVAPGIAFPQGMSLCTLRGSSCSGSQPQPRRWRGGDTGTEEMALAEGTPEQTAQSPQPWEAEDGVGMKPGSLQAPLQPQDQQHPSGTQHSVPCQPRLAQHSDICQLWGTQVPPWQLHTPTPTVSVPLEAAAA